MKVQHTLNEDICGQVTRLFENTMISVPTPSKRIRWEWDVEAPDLMAMSSLPWVQFANIQHNGHKPTLCEVFGEWSEGVWIALYARGRHVSIDLGGASFAVDGISGEVYHWARGLYQRPQARDDLVCVRFNVLDERGNRRTIFRALTTPRWEDIAENYTDQTQRRLGQLMALSSPSEGGHLILLHGPPGTGKTWSIRALARQWSSWCQIEYVVDPERFLGTDANYLVQAILDYNDYDLNDSVGPEGDNPQWHVFILEDTGELLAHDAKAISQQGLSRLLNLSDGLLGQGLPIVFILTTNEPIEQFHEAVVRPGRCLANIEFGRLSSGETRAWLRAHGHESRVVGSLGPSTLSDLYALIGGRELSGEPDISPGFRI